MAAADEIWAVKKIFEPKDAGIVNTNFERATVRRAEKIQGGIRAGISSA